MLLMIQKETQKVNSALIYNLSGKASTSLP